MSSYTVSETEYKKEDWIKWDETDYIKMWLNTNKMRLNIYKMWLNTNKLRLNIYKMWLNKNKMKLNIYKIWLNIYIHTHIYIYTYLPVSLLPICGKIFEGLLYNRLYECFIENELISSSQSGFKSGDSCINQLLSISHDIYQSFDNGFEVRGVFLDISKAFNKLWHKGLIYKLKQNGVAGNLLNTLADFLIDRKQGVVLNVQNSTWVNIEAGVLQGSILGSLLYLIYIKDLSENLVSNPKLFADDTSFFQ